MNNEIKVFSNEEFGSIRRVEIDGEYWLSGKDVAQALGYAKPENALSAHVDDEDKTTTLVQGTGSNYKSKATVINESGLYSLVLSSKLPSAKKFKRWVTSEVLPSVRKHGAYMTPETLEAAILNPDYLLKVATALKAARHWKRRFRQMRPKFCSLTAWPLPVARFLWVSWQRSCGRMVWTWAKDGCSGGCGTMGT